VDPLEEKGKKRIQRRAPKKRQGKRRDSRESLVSELLSNRKRLPGKRSLIHGNLDSIGESAIRGADVSVLERDLKVERKTRQF